MGLSESGLFVFSFSTLTAPVLLIQTQPLHLVSVLSSSLEH